MKRMRFAAGPLLALLAFGVMAAGCDNGSSPSSSLGQYDATRPIVCLGDSLTAGMIDGADRPEKSWPARLQEKVSVEVINAGVSGDTTADALARLERDVLSKNPQIAIIALGGNDLDAINPINPQATLNSIKANLQTIIDRTKAANRKLYLANFLSEPYVAEVAGGMYPPAVLSPALITMLHGALAEVYTSLAAENNIALIENVITAEMANSHISADGVHLDETGYAMLADNIFNAIKPFLLEHNLAK